MKAGEKMTYFLGVDLGGTNIKYVVIEIDDNKTTEVLKNQISTDATQGPEKVTANISRLISEMDAKFNLANVCVAVPGIFDHENGNILLFPNLPGAWSHFPFKQKITELSGKTISLINDARAFCLAEATLGAGKGFRYVACIVMGTGVGGGIVIDGEIHEGASRGAGEIAHQVVSAEGSLCGCGTRGCAETFASSQAISRMANASSPEEAFEKAKAGDEKAISAFQSAGKWLGIALANVNAVFSPEIFIIGGGVAQAGELVIDSIKKELHERNHLWPNSVFEVVPAQLSYFAGATGAALRAAADYGVSLKALK